MRGARKHEVHLGLWVAALTLAALASPTWAAGQDQPPVATMAPRATLADLAWMAGDWVSGAEGDLSEEIWAAPAGDCMMGMWRWVTGGKVKLFEFLALTMDEEGPVLRLRHFDRQLTGWAIERDGPLRMKLLRRRDGEAVFEGAEGAKTVRLTYRKSGADGLFVLLEEEAPEKGMRKSEFVFRRKAGTP